MEDETVLPEIQDINRIALDPDDVVVVRSTANISASQADRIKEIVCARLRIDADRVLVLGAGMNIDVVKP